MAVKLLAAGSLFALTLAAPTSAGRNVDTYHTYVGTAHSQNWPSMDKWFSSFDAMYEMVAMMSNIKC
jgi:hypothetical protein